MAIAKIQLTRAQIVPALTQGLPIVSILASDFPEVLAVDKTFLFWEYHGGGPTGRNFLAKVRALTWLKSGLASESDETVIRGAELDQDFQTDDRVLVHISRRYPDVTLEEDAPGGSTFVKLAIYRDPTGLDFWVNCGTTDPPSVVEGPWGNLYLFDSGTTASIVELNPRLRGGEFELVPGPTNKLTRKRGAYINIL